MNGSEDGFPRNLADGDEDPSSGTDSWWRRGPLTAIILIIVALIAGGVTIGLAVTRDPSDSPTGRHPSAAGTTGTGGTVASGAAGVGQSPGPTLDAAEARLRSSLKPFAVGECASAPPSEGQAVPGGVEAALSCVPGVATDAPAPARILVLRYPDASALARDIARRSAALAGVGNCYQGQTGIERWARSSRRRGTFLCDAGPGRFSVFWTVDDERLGFATEDPQADKLLAWWREFDPV
ncbi:MULTISPECIES: hypothetical protein [unclassified Frankia]